MDRFVGDRPPLNEAGHQDSLRFDEGDHLGTNAAGGGQPAGLMLESSIDAQQAAGRGRDAHHEDVAVDSDAVIPIRDATAERLDRARTAGPTWHPIHDARAEDFHLHGA